MPDFRMCDEHQCPFNGQCARYLAVPYNVQTYGRFVGAGTRACAGWIDAEDYSGPVRSPALVRRTYAQMIDITPKDEKENV
jgi:hypothetical protein